MLLHPQVKRQLIDRLITCSFVNAASILKPSEMFRHSDVSYTTVNSSTHCSRIIDRTSTWMLLPDRGYICDETRKNNTWTDTDECPQKSRHWFLSREITGKRCRRREDDGAHLVVPGWDAVQAVVLVQQVDRLTQKTAKQKNSSYISIYITSLWKPGNSKLNVTVNCEEIWHNIKEWTSFWSNQAERLQSAAGKVTSCLLSSETVMLKQEREETQLLTRSWKSEWDVPSLGPSIICGKVGCHVGWRSDTRKLNYSINTLKRTTHLSCEFGAVNNRQQASLWFHFSPTESLTIVSESKLLLKVSEMTSASSSELFEVGASNGPVCPGGQAEL